MYINIRRLKWYRETVRSGKYIDLLFDYVRGYESKQAQRTCIEYDFCCTLATEQRFR